MKLRKQTRLKSIMGSFERAMETDKHIYYVNFIDGDENVSVIMLDRKMNVIDKTYSAYLALMDDIEKGYTWMNEKLKKNLDIKK